jgi:predicted Zn-dependent protease
MSQTMDDPMIANLERLLARGQDSAALRYALASRYLAAGEPKAAIRHAQAAVALEPEYSAAWKLLGSLNTELGESTAAIAAYEQGIVVAERRGDQQAAKEMRVFLKRLRATEPRDG